MKDKTICSICGAEIMTNSITEFNGKKFCNDCLRQTTTTCDCCGERIYRDEMQGNEFVSLCENC